MEEKAIVLIGGQDPFVYVGSKSYSKMKDVLKKANCHTAHKWDIGCQCFPMWSKTSQVEWHCEGCGAAHEFMNFVSKNMSKNEIKPEDYDGYQSMYKIFATLGSECPTKKTKEIPECEDCVRNKEEVEEFDEPVSVFYMDGLKTCTVVPDRLLTDELRNAERDTVDELLHLKQRLIDIGGSHVRFPVRAKEIKHVYEYTFTEKLKI